MFFLQKYSLKEHASHSTVKFILDWINDPLAPLFAKNRYNFPQVPENQTVLELVAKENNLTALRFLARQVDINSRLTNNKTALHFIDITKEDALDSLEFLLS